MRRRAFLVGGTGSLLLLGEAARADYLEDGRTARAVALKIPRTPLANCLRALSETTVVSLSAAAALAGEHLVGYVPRRPLRETMDALAELFDGTWTSLPGKPSSYRLDPVPEKSKAHGAARKALLAQYVRAIDEKAAEVAKDAQRGKPLDTSDRLTAFGLLLWSHLSPPDRERVLSGESVTVSIPEPQAGIIHRVIQETMTAASNQQPGPVTGPAFATFDLDDRAPSDAKLQGLPTLRARATGMGANSATGAIGFVSFVGFVKGHRTPVPALPQSLSGVVREVSGTRDELVLLIGAASRLPILSRQRGAGGNAWDFPQGERPISEMIVGLAERCDATLTVTARGYQLLRSQTELLDHSCQIPLPLVQAYLKDRPAMGKPVPFAHLAQLGSLTPMQLSLLELANLCSEDAQIAGDTYALLRFYQALAPEQRAALFAPAGIEVRTLTHAQLHQLLDQRDKRGEFDLITHLQDFRGLRLRFREKLEGRASTVVLQALRGEETVSQNEFALPIVREEKPVVATIQ